MYSEINDKLNQKVNTVIDTLIEFSKTETLDNGQKNLFSKYLNFTSKNEFWLGNKHFKFGFSNYPLIQKSYLKLYLITQSKETYTELKETTLDILFIVDISGVVNLFGSTEQTMYHHLGNTFFSGLENYITNNKL